MLLDARLRCRASHSHRASVCDPPGVSTLNQHRAIARDVQEKLWYIALNHDSELVSIVGSFGKEQLHCLRRTFTACALMLETFNVPAMSGCALASA